MSKTFEALDAMREKVWEHVVQGMANPKHPARSPTFATTSPEGWPEVRSLVLRAVDTEQATLAFYTDLQSDKVASLKKDPRAGLHIWIREEALQIRMSLQVEIQSGATVQHIWQRLPDRSQFNYGVEPAPGRPLDSAKGYKKTPKPESFAVLHCSVLTIEALHLGAGHTRAIYARSNKWQGQWVSP